ncbi:hypothetical protein [Streptomyces sp. NPDC050504]|uniref:hypothetical protein n=1 Tax=Streptomyces sp. NPDC050504 TaxID=3365618 RepID=UPI0037AA9E9B
MSERLYTTARPAAYATSLLLALSVLLTVLLPTERAAAAPVGGRSVERAPMPVASFGDPDEPKVTDVSPMTGETGRKVTVKVTGAALRQEDYVQLIEFGRTVEKGTTVSVSPDRKTLTAVLDLTGVAPGSWSLSVYAHNRYNYFVDSFEVTPARRLRNTAPPTLTGTARVGAKVSVSAGSWSQVPDSYAYQWRAGGVPVPGATAATYTVPAALRGKALSVTVTARRAGLADGTATTAAATVAAGAAPKAVKAPAISGTAKVGRTLSVVRGTWSPAPTAYTYQWYANGRAIAGATGSTLALKAAQRGLKITVQVAAARTGHLTGKALSRATAPVAR